MTGELEGTNFVLQMRLEFFGKAELQKDTNKAVTRTYNKFTEFIFRF